MRAYRPLPAVLFAILVSALVGGLFGRSALATDDKGGDQDREQNGGQGTVASHDR